MFPGAAASVYYNEAGEPLGWDYPAADDPYDPDDYLAGGYDDEADPTCPWCADPASDDDDPPIGTLCRMHLAEYEGLSVAELDRRVAEEAAEQH